MKHDPHRPIEYIVRVPLACCFFTTGSLFLLSGLIALFPVQNTAVFLLALMAILLGVSSFASFGFSISNLATVVFLDETGMTVRCFNRIKYSLPWDQIRFAGVCTKHSYRGMQKRYCFAAHELSQQERNDIAHIKIPHIYFSWLTQAELDYICCHSPVQPDSDAEQFLSHNRKRIRE